MCGGRGSAPRSTLEQRVRPPLCAVRSPHCSAAQRRPKRAEHSLAPTPHLKQPPMQQEDNHGLEQSAAADAPAGLVAATAADGAATATIHDLPDSLLGTLFAQLGSVK